MFAIDNHIKTRLFTCCMLVLLPSAMALAATSRPAPVTITADDAQLSKTQAMSTYTGNVVVVRDTLTLKGNKLVVRRQDNGEYKAVMTGSPATFRREPATSADKLVTGHSHTITYYTGKTVVTMRGDAVVDREGDIIRSNVIRHDMDAEKTYAGDPSDDTDRVKMVLHPDSNAQN